MTPHLHTGARLEVAGGKQRRRPRPAFHSCLGVAPPAGATAWNALREAAPAGPQTRRNELVSVRAMQVRLDLQPQRMQRTLDRPGPENVHGANNRTSHLDPEINDINRLQLMSGCAIKALARP